MAEANVARTVASDYLSGDEQFKAVERTMKRFNYENDALLEVLNTAQETYGYLSKDVLTVISDQLHVPLSLVYGVASFYSIYTLESSGDHTIFVCIDPACAIAGSDQIYAAAHQHAADNIDITARIERVTCLGLCDQAPVALANDTAYVGLRAGEVSALFDGRAERSSLRIAGEPRIMTRLVGELPPLDLEAHREQGSFAALQRVLSDMTPDQVIDRVKESGLSGRGGAGFSTGLKWQFTRQAAGTPKYVICNFDESEPGTFKDRLLVQGDPFRVLEGLIIAAYAIGASQGYVFVRGEYVEAARLQQTAIDTLYDAGLLGQDILGSGFSFDLDVRRGAGAYICGEETALFEAVEGKRGYPRRKPPFPTTHGLFGKPTAINNVETLALVPDLILNDSGWLRQWGTDESLGIKLFCLSGHVNKPGVIEVPYGITVRQLIEQYGGGFQGEPQAILMGGATGGLLHPDDFDAPLAHEALRPLGAAIGSGVIMVFNQDVSLLGVLKRLANFFVHETCGQCTPCRIGTIQIYKLLDKMLDSQATSADVDKLEHLSNSLKRLSLCGLGQAAPNPILSSLRFFRDEYEAAIKNNGL